MNKLFTKIAALALGMTMATGVGVAVASSSKSANPVYATIPSTSEEAFEVTFTKGASDSATTAPSIASGTDYATKGTTTTAYARTKGLHLGSSNNTGSQIINFTAAKGQIQATYISVYAIQVDSGKSLKTTVTYTDSTTTTNTTATGSSLAYIDIALTSTKTISSVKFESVTKSKGRVAIDSFKIYKEKAAQSDYVGSLSASPSTWSGYDSDTLSVSSFTISGSKNGVAGAVTSADYEYKGIGYMNGDDFVARVADFSSGHPITADTRLAWKAKYPTTSGGSTYAWAYVTLTVTADSVSSIALSSNMSTTSYTTADSWVSTGLVVTATYASSNTDNVTASSTFHYYSDSAMTDEVATPNDLGVGNNQKIYVKATYSGVSNATGYEQTVSVTKAPSVQTATINLADITLNDSHSQDTTDVSITEGAVTFAWTKVSGSTNANNYIGGYNSRTQTRIYTGHRLTITADGNTLKSVNFTGVTGTSNGPNKMDTWTGGTLSDYSTSDGTATVTASNNVTSLICQPTANTYLYSAVVEFYAADVPAEGITINGETSSSVSITPYQTTRLVASVLPVTATDRAFAWSMSPSGNDAIITIDENGNVEPVAGKYGETVVTATSHDGGFTATCTVTVEHVSYYQAVYYPASTSSVTTSGTLPQGESHTFSCGNYQSGYAQLTTNSPTAVLTLSGYDGQQVRAVLLKMHSNGSAGSGSLSIVAGETTVASISTAPFSDETWNGEYTTDWVLIEPDFTLYDVGDSEDITITITATVNSLYLSEVRVQYEPSAVDTTAVQFAQMILDDITCDNGVTPPDPEDWGALVELWDDGSTITADGKQTLLDAQAVEHQTPATDEETIQAAMAKYDYIVGKYNKTLGLTTDYPDFIGRNPAPVGNSRILVNSIIGENGNSIAIIVIVSVVSISAVGGYFFLRKRKEN